MRLLKDVPAQTVLGNVVVRLTADGECCEGGRCSERMP